MRRELSERSIETPTIREVYLKKKKQTEITRAENFEDFSFIYLLASVLLCVFRFDSEFG